MVINQILKLGGSKYGPLTNGQNVNFKVCVEKSGLNLGHGWATDGP